MVDQIPQSQHTNRRTETVSQHLHDLNPVLLKDVQRVEVRLSYGLVQSLNVLVPQDVDQFLLGEFIAILDVPLRQVLVVVELGGESEGVTDLCQFLAMLLPTDRE